MGSMQMGNGFSLNTLVGGLLVFFIKLLVIVLIIAFIASVFMWLKNNFAATIGQKSKQSKTQHTIHNDPTIKVVTWLTVFISGVVLIYAALMGFNQNGMMNMAQSSANIMPTIVTTLILLARLLTWILTISLILGAFVYIKNEYQSGNLNFQGQKNQVVIRSDGTMETNNQQNGTNS